MKNCIILSAIPGSGKSTWAHRYQKEHPHTFIVSSDDIREELYGSATCFEHEPIVWQTFLDRLNDYGNLYDDSTVIADATCLQNKFRQFYSANTPNFDKHTLVLFDIPLDICKKQNKMRTGERVVPDYAMDRLINEYQAVDDETSKYFDEVVVIKDFVAK